MNLLARTNDAVKINDPPAGSNQHLTTSGSDWLWAVFALYALSLLIVVGLTYIAPNRERIFHYLLTVSLFVGTIAYFAHASDLGSVAVSQADNGPDVRQIFYARYINWFVGWTPIVIAVGLISGKSWATIIYDIGLLWIWIVSWLAGALCTTTYKWGFFTFGLFSEILLDLSFLHVGSLTAKRLGITRHYSAIAGWLAFIWMLYPIAYGVDDGGNVIGVVEGWIFFGIIDILVVPVTAFLILALSPRWDYRAMNLYFTQYGRVAQGADLPEREHEKAPAPAAATTSTPAATTTPAATGEQAV